MKIGDRIRRLRREKDRTQEWLAESLGVSPSFISMIENNKSDLPSSMLEKIAKALEVRIVDLMVDLKTIPDVGTRDVDPSPRSIAMIPFLGKIVASPDGKEVLDDSAANDARVPYYPGNYFALEIESDSMIHAEPEIYPGDICIFESGRQPKNGDIVAVQFVQNHRRMVKIFHQISGTEVELRSANRFRSYFSVKFKKDEIASYGILVAKLKLLDEEKKRLGIG
jgi:SOS-response transcriptional repressor LexA